MFNLKFGRKQKEKDVFQFTSVSDLTMYLAALTGSLGGGEGGREVRKKKPVKLMSVFTNSYSLSPKLWHRRRGIVWLVS